MTNDMCGIEPTTMQTTTRMMSGERKGTRVVRRVPPLQGGEGLFGPSSQGVALGWRVVAPLARQTDATPTMFLARMNGCANGAIPVSPGQRPGDSANDKMISPERAIPGCPLAQARDLEQTIAGSLPLPVGEDRGEGAQRMAEILEAGVSRMTLSMGWECDRVPPFQGGNGFIGRLSQGVALGCRVVAPLARKDGCANGAKPISLGQRPRNSAMENFPSPERATDGTGDVPARALEQTIAGNVVEILEA